MPRGTMPPQQHHEQFLHQPLTSDAELALRWSGFATRPSDVKPPTSDAGRCMIYIQGREEEQVSTDEVQFAGVWLFTDGSCSKHKMASRLNRAGWAVVKIDPSSGQLLVALAGPVLREWPQTSPSSEVAVACMALAFAAEDVGCKFYTDWQGITRLFGPKAALSKRQVWAGPARAARGRVDWEFEWTPSHRDPSQEAEGAHEWCTAVGNSWADEWAAIGRGLHPEQEHGVAEEAVAQAAAHHDFLIHAGKALARWARDDREHISRRRRPPGARCGRERRTPALSRPHVWTAGTAQSVQRCARCLASRSAHSEQRACVGGHFLERLLVAPMGHDVVVFTAAGCLPLVACKRCGATAESLPRGLGKECLGEMKPQAKLRIDRLFAEGRHPRQERVDGELRYTQVPAQHALAADTFELEDVEPIPRRLYHRRRRHG